MTALQTNTGSQHANAYLRTKVMSASPEELRLLLLEGAVKFARQGLEGLDRKNFEAMYAGVSQCRNIIFELLTTIREDLAPDLAANVKALYSFMYKHLLEASMEKHAGKMSEVIELLEYERETWILLMQKLAEERAAGKVQPQSPQPAPPSEHRPTLSVQG